MYFETTPEVQAIIDRHRPKYSATKFVEAIIKLYHETCMACSAVFDSLPPHIVITIEDCLNLIKEIFGKWTSGPNKIPFEEVSETLKAFSKFAESLTHADLETAITMTGANCPPDLTPRFEKILEKLRNNQPQNMEEGKIATPKRKRSASGASPTPPPGTEEESDQISDSQQSGTATGASAAPPPSTVVENATSIEILAVDVPLPDTRPPSPAITDQEITPEVINIPEAAKPRSFRPEPFFVKIDKDWTKFISDLNFCLETPISARITGDTARLLPKSEIDSTTTLNFLKDGKFEYSASTPKWERPKKIAIRGIPFHVETTEITQALTSLGFHVLNAQNIKNRSTGQCYNLFMVTLKPTEKWASVYQVKDLLHLKVNIKPFTNRGKRQPQCFKCQRYGHSSQICSFELRCVKCAKAHTAADCPLPAESSPSCCLCNGNHTANYSRCPAAQARRGKKSAKSNQPVAPPAPPPKVPVPPKSTKSSRKKSYADVVALPPAPFVPRPVVLAELTKESKKSNRKRPALSAAVAAESSSATPVEEMEISVPTLESPGQVDLPSETKELMHNFVSCVNEVRAWFSGGSFSLPKFAAVWGELEKCFNVPADPDTQMKNLFATLSTVFKVQPEA